MLATDGIVRGRQFLWVPDLSPDYFVPFTALWVAAGLSFAAGFVTRIRGSILVSCTVYQFLLDQSLHCIHSYLLGLLILLLTVGNSGVVLSIDWIRRGRPDVSVLLWPTRLPGVQSASRDPVCDAADLFVGRGADVATAAPGR